MMVTQDLVSRFSANTMMKRVADEMGGTGGGRPDMAQAGGTDVSKLDHALDSIYEIVEGIGKD
jgi:alanyl-tRNA synthetase